jgi:hypothetical protein
MEFVASDETVFSVILEPRLSRLYDLHSQVDLASCTESFGSKLDASMICWTKATLSVHIVRAEFNLSGLRSSAFQVSDFCGKNRSMVKPNAVSLVSTLFSYG